MRRDDERLRFAHLALLAAAGVAAALVGGCGREAGDPVDRAARSISRQRIEKTGRRLADDAMAGRYYASPANAVFSIKK